MRAPPSRVWRIDNLQWQKTNAREAYDNALIAIIYDMIYEGNRLNADKLYRVLSSQSAEDLAKWGEEHLIHYHGIIPSVIKEGEGAILRDVTGKEYLDFASIAVAVNIGHGDKRVTEAMKEQLDSISSITTTFFNIPEVKLAKLIAEITPEKLTRSFFLTSGSEAVELALKTARRYTGKLKIFSRWGGYHGNTLGALSASGAALYKRSYDPAASGFLKIQPPYCYRCDFGLEYPDCAIMCVKALENAIVYEHPETIAAVIAEPIIGGGGAVVPPDEYIPELRRICDKHGIPLILDEVITGFGRTGKMFCCEHYDVTPDIMTVAKGIGSCYVPLSAVITTDTIADTMGDFTKGVHFSTYGNHPLSCAAALANIRVIIEDKLADNAAKMGDYCLNALKDAVEESEVLGEARGKGLLLGVEIVRDKQSKTPDPELGAAIRKKALEKGLYFSLSNLRMKDAVIAVFGPPLNITQEQVDRALETFNSAVKEAQAGQ